MESKKTADRRAATRKLIRDLGILPVLVLIIVMFSLATDTFMTGNNLVNIFRQASINIVLAVGMTLVILTGGIDLSVGSILATTAVIGVMTSLNPSLQWGTVLFPLLIGLAVGLINGVLVAYVKLPPFIATMGTMTTFRGASYLIPDAPPSSTTTSTSRGSATTTSVPSRGSWSSPWSWWPSPGSSFARPSWRTHLRRRRQPPGRAPDGIKVGFVLVFVYAASGLLCGLAGVMTSSRLYSASGLLGNGYELDAVAAAILGGTSPNGGIGSVAGTLVGALIMAVLNNGLTLMNVSSFWQMVIRGIVIILAVIIDKFRTRTTA
jgi:ribose transport system permease protein